MNILIYKRTHTGDPDDEGYFGVNRCMGSVRKWDFDAVIGIGGTSKEPKKNIDRKINWIGIGVTEKKRVADDYPLLKFEKFVLCDEQGPALESYAPSLARRMYNDKARFLLHAYNDKERKEAENIINNFSTISKKYGKNSALPASNLKDGCDKKCGSPSSLKNKKCTSC